MADNHDPFFVYVEMFPSIDTKLVEAICQASGGDHDEIIDKLLKISDDLENLPQVEHQNRSLPSRDVTAGHPAGSVGGGKIREKQAYARPRPPDSDDDMPQLEDVPPKGTDEDDVRASAALEALLLCLPNTAAADGKRILAWCDQDVNVCIDSVFEHGGVSPFLQYLETQEAPSIAVESASSTAPATAVLKTVEKRSGIAERERKQPEPSAAAALAAVPKTGLGTLRDVFPDLSTPDGLRLLQACDNDVGVCIERLLEYGTIEAFLEAAAAVEVPSTPSPTKKAKSASKASKGGPGVNKSVIAPAVVIPDMKSRAQRVEEWLAIFPLVGANVVDAAISRHSQESREAADNAIYNNLKKHTERISSQQRVASDDPPRVAQQRMNPVPAPVGAPVARAKPRSPAAQAAPTGKPHRHILWDFDNIPLSAVGNDPVRFVGSLKSFFTRDAIFHIKVFIVPSSDVREQQLNLLRNVGVTVVTCNGAKEGADAEINKCINEFLSLNFPPQVHEIVIVSSDKDFTVIAQHVVNSGYKISCVHQAYHYNHVNPLKAVYTNCVTVASLMN